MDPNTVTLIVSITGITATLISSSLGLYFTAKARSSPLREILYKKQIDLINLIISKIGRIRLFLTILKHDDITFRRRALDDLGNFIKNISELTDQATAILPTELWIELKKYLDKVTSVSVDFKEETTIDSDQLEKIIILETKFVLVARSVLGVDELTEESIKIFSSKKDFDRLINIETSYFKSMVKNANN